MPGCGTGTDSTGNVVRTMNNVSFQNKDGSYSVAGATKRRDAYEKDFAKANANLIARIKDRKAEYDSIQKEISSASSVGAAVFHANRAQELYKTLEKDTETLAKRRGKMEKKVEYQLAGSVIAEGGRTGKTRVTFNQNGKSAKSNAGRKKKGAGNQAVTTTTQKSVAKEKKAPKPAQPTAPASTGSTSTGGRRSRKTTATTAPASTATTTSTASKPKRARKATATTAPASTATTTSTASKPKRAKKATATTAPATT